MKLSRVTYKSLQNCFELMTIWPIKNMTFVLRTQIFQLKFASIIEAYIGLDVGYVSVVSHKMTKLE